MSNHLQYFDGEFALGTTLLDTQNTIKSNLVACGWQVITEDTTNYVLDVIPPASQLIGDGRVYEVLRFKLENLKIHMYGYMKCVADYLGQTFTIEEKTAGNAVGSVSIGSATVTQSTSSATNTATDNLRQLWLDLRASTDPTFMDWNFYYHPPYKGQSGIDGTTGLIIAYRKTITSTRLSIAVNTNVTLFDSMVFYNGTTWLEGAGLVAGTVQKLGCSWIDDHITLPSANLTRDVTLDLTNGCVYFMDVFERTVYLATKCNTGYTGPVVASYVDNAEARSVTPKGTPQIAVPIELYVMCLDTNYGYTSTAIDVRNTALITHAFGRFETNPGIYQAKSTGHPETWSRDQSLPDVFLMNCASRNWMNCATYSNYGGTATGRYFPIAGTLFGLQISNSNTLDDFAIEVASSSGLFNIGSTSYGTPDYVVPPCNLPDVYAMIGTTPTESVHLVPDERVSTTTTASYDATTTYGTIEVVSTGSFPASGAFVLNNEVWNYTGKTSVAFTGCSRAQNGSKAEPTDVGTEVRPGVWFVRMVRGALRVGSAKPV